MTCANSNVSGVPASRTTYRLRLRASFLMPGLRRNGTGRLGHARPAPGLTAQPIPTPTPPGSIGSRRGFIAGLTGLFADIDADEALFRQ